MDLKLAEQASALLITKSDLLRQFTQQGLAKNEGTFALQCTECGDHGRVVETPNGAQAGHFECKCGAHRWVSKRELGVLKQRRGATP